MNYRSNKILIFIMIGIAVILPKNTFGQSGPVNANFYNWQIDFEVFCGYEAGTGLGDGENSTNEYKLRAAALPDVDGSINNYSWADLNNFESALCVEVDGPPGVCSSFDYKTIASFPALPFQIDLVVGIWEEDGIIAPCKSNMDDQTLKLDNARITIDPTKVGPEATSHLFDELDKAGSSFQSRWRYFFGESSTPLDFGTLTLTDDYAHFNSNQFATVVADGTEGIHSEFLIYPNQKVFYSFSLSEQVTVEISTDDPLTTHVDTKLILYNNSNIEIASNDDIIGLANQNSKITKLLPPGNYKVEVASVGLAGSTGGDFNLKIKTISPPDNNFCNDAIELTVNESDCTMTTYSSLGAQRSILSDPCVVGASADDDVWFLFIPTSSSITITVEGDPDFHPTFALYKDSCPDGSTQPEACGGELGENTATYSGTVIQGDTYYIRVFDQEEGFINAQSFTICITITPPPNDECVNATLLNVNSGMTTISTIGTTLAATDSGIDHDGNSCNGYDGGDVWFKFTAPESGTIDAFASALNNVEMAVYDKCNPDSSLACGITSVIAGDLTPGQDYYIAVWFYDGQGSGMFSISVYELVTAIPIPCILGYTGDNSLSGLVDVNSDYSTDQSIESTQCIGSSTEQISVTYSAGNNLVLTSLLKSLDEAPSVDLNEGFEVKGNTVFEVIFDGCSVTSSATGDNVSNR